MGDSSRFRPPVAKTITGLNDRHVKHVRVESRCNWHTHNEPGALVLVVKGTSCIDLRDEEAVIKQLVARILNIFEGAAEIQTQVIARRLLEGERN